jgi:tRNA acetyltransferase TAN1
MAQKPQVTPGMVGIMATCVKDKEKFATRELFALFNEYADTLYGPEEELDHHGNVEDAFDQEVKNMNKPKTRFTALMPGMPCCIFIRVMDPVDPVKLVETILNDLQTKQQYRTRHVNRILPLSIVCHATLLDIAKTTKQLMDTMKPEETFALMPRIRFTESISRNVLIDHVAKQVTNKVDLESPDVVVILEIFKNVCGVGLVRDYYKLKKFNLYELVEKTLDNLES